MDSSLVPELVKQWAAAAARALLQGAFGYLIAHGFITEGLSTSTIGWASGFLAVLAWSLYQKYLAAKLVAFLQGKGGDPNA